ncbi:MAG: hypothetical protein H7Z17_08250 [Fuerstia sp.]|nr:hypothetical protein [Fuerstiella sp.]
MDARKGSTGSSAFGQMTTLLCGSISMKSMNFKRAEIPAIRSSKLAIFGSSLY